MAISVLYPGYARELVGASWRNNEDFLTAEFFSTVRYLNMTALLGLLSEAQLVRGSPAQDDWSFPPGIEATRITLWPEYDEGVPDGQVDFLAKRAEPAVIMAIEVKLHSGPSDKDGEKPQLERYLAALDKHARGKQRALLYVTTHWEIPDEAKQAATRSRTPLLWISWHQIADQLREMLINNVVLHPTSLVLEDLLETLRARGIRPQSELFQAQELQQPSDVTGWLATWRPRRP